MAVVVVVVAVLTVQPGEELVPVATGANELME
jgi:hypothetical protein